MRCLLLTVRLEAAIDPGVAQSTVPLTVCWAPVSNSCFPIKGFWPTHFADAPCRYQSAEGGPASGADGDDALVFEDDVVLPITSPLVAGSPGMPQQ